MRLLKLDDEGGFRLTPDLGSNIPPYAILSHTWGEDDEEVTFEELNNGPRKKQPGHRKFRFFSKQDRTEKLGYRKLRFCGKQARKDGLEYFWVDTCCINKANFTELSEAINSMFKWYSKAEKCYVYLSDVKSLNYPWEAEFRKSRWFTRGWTLQELLAPSSVDFFSRDEELLGTKLSLETLIHSITQIPAAALQMKSLSDFSVDERLQWAAERHTKKPEDKAYCLLGIFDIFMPLIYGEGQKAYERLRGEIARGTDSTSPVTSTNVHWTVLRSCNPLFTGREETLQDFERVIKDAISQAKPQQKQCQIVITGIGGQGKSELCLQLAHRLRQMFWGVFWIDVSTTSLAENAFLDLAQRLSVSASTWQQALLGLANLKHTWLLVLDNADDPHVDYQQYIPTGFSGIIVMTSRNNDCEQYATASPIKLKGLSDKSAQELLYKAAHIPLRERAKLADDAQRVASLLQSHTLALVQAGAYVYQGYCTLANYPGVFERQRQRLLGFRPKQAQSRYGDVYATFEASADILKETKSEAAQDALQLIPLLAVCGPNRFPLFLFELAWKGAKRVPTTMDDEAEDDKVALLTPWHVSHLPSLVQTTSTSWDSYRMLEAVNLLKTLSLVSIDCVEEHRYVSMHPLVHAWARDRQDENEQHASWLGMGCVFVLSQHDEGFWRKYERQLRPHIEMLIEWEMYTMFAAEPRVLIARILVNIGYVLSEMRIDKKLYTLLEKLCKWLELDPVSVSSQWVGLYHLIARNFFNCGNVKQSIAVFKTVVEIRGQVLAKDHPDRLSSEHELARAYHVNGQVKESVALIEQVVKIRRKILVEDHPDRLASEHELASVYLANGQVKEAVALLEQVVKIEAKILVEDHPDRLASEHELAGVYQANGQVKEAVALLEQVVGIKRKILAEDHPDRLASEHALARAYHANGQVKEAIALLEQVVKIKAKILVEDHPDRLVSEDVMAAYLWDLGQHQAALDMMAQVVNIRQRSLAEDHPNRLGSEHNMAIYLWELGQHQAALEMMARVVEVRQRSLAEDHPDRQNSEEWLQGMKSELSERH